MADTAPAPRQELASHAVEVLERARQQLAVMATSSTTIDDRSRIVQEAADRLAVAATDQDCPRLLSNVLLDWRDRLGSHVLAARALADLDVHPELADQLLVRGLDEAIEESTRRFQPARDPASA